MSHAPQPPAAPPDEGEQTAVQHTYSMHADICRVLTDPKRLMIIDALRDGEKSVGVLAERLGMRLANASQHLGVLRHSGLVDSRRDGTTIYYHLTEPRIVEACDAIHQIVRLRLGSAPRLPGTTG